jgi:HlyD family secretion protein
MNFLSKLFRYATFGFSLAGMVMMALVIQQIRGQENKLPPPPVAPPQKPFNDTVAATGIIEAVDENVSIGTPGPGLITAVEVKVNQQVKEGDALLRLDDRELQAALLKQRAQVALARARIDVQQAMVAKAQDMLDRVRSVGGKAVSVDEVEQRGNDLKVARAQAAAAEAELAAAEADVQQSERLIERLVVRAPRAGAILQVNVRAGEYASVSPKSPPVVLGNIGLPGAREYHVRADVDEQSAARIRGGNLRHGTASIKGDTRTRFELDFVRVEPFVIPKVSLTGASTERVDTRVLQVIFRLRHNAAKDPPLYVGQQVDVFIDAGSAEPGS